MAKHNSPAAGLCLAQLDQGTHSHVFDTSAHGLLPAVASMFLGRAEGQWRVRSFKGACSHASKCLCIDWYSPAPACWLQSDLSAGPDACLTTGRSCCLSAASSFSPVEETVNHWWVLYLNDSAAPPPREPGCNNPESLRRVNPIPLPLASGSRACRSPVVWNMKPWEPVF